MGFVEWYSAMGISPVSQDIEDLDRHFERREGLVRSLGLVPAWIGGRRLLEFGPVLYTLAGNYEVHGTSPRFLTDWRWYKSLTGENTHLNEVALTNYYSKNLNLIDKRFGYDSHSPAFGIWLEETAQRAWDYICRSQSGDSGAWNDFYGVSDELVKALDTVTPGTAA